MTSSYKKQKFGNRDKQREDDGRTQMEDGHLQARGCPRLSEAKRKPGSRLFLSECSNPDDPLISEKKQYTSVLKAPTWDAMF
jgi:hypothetical protein